MESLNVLHDKIDEDGVRLIEIAIKFKMRKTPFYLTLCSDYSLQEVIQEIVRLTSTLVANALIEDYDEKG